MRVHKKIYWSFYLIILLAAAAICCEVILRIDGRYKNYNEINGQPYVSIYKDSIRGGHSYRYASFMDSIVVAKTEFTHQRSVNDLGFTDHRNLADIDTLSKPLVSILVLGDSFTEGVGAAYEESWCSALEHLLNKSSEDSLGYLVYNAGIAGCDPLFEFQNLKFLVPIIRPQIVISLINSSDFHDIYLRGGWERFKPDGTTRYLRKSPWFEPMYEHSHLVRAILRSLLRYNLVLTPDTDEDIRQFSIPFIIQALDSCSNFLESSEIRWMPVFHPIPYNGIFPDNVRQNDSMFVLKLRGSQQNFLDLSPAVYESDLSKNFWKSDWHCTPLGYQLFAQEIFSALKNEIDADTAILIP